MMGFASPRCHNRVGISIPTGMRQCFYNMRIIVCLCKILSRTLERRILEPVQISAENVNKRWLSQTEPATTLEQRRIFLFPVEFYRELDIRLTFGSSLFMPILNTNKIY